MSNVQDLAQLLTCPSLVLNLQETLLPLNFKDEFFVGAKEQEPIHSVCCHMKERN